MTKLLKTIFRAFGSFGFAAILLLFLLLLTWLGTLEQVEHGLFDVQKKYFESLALVHWAGPYDLRLPSISGGEFRWSHSALGPIPIPLPGVYLVLALLLANLFIGGIIRLRKDKERVGILIAHLGIVMMLVAGYVKFAFSVDGNLALGEPIENAPRNWPAQVGDEFQSYYDWDLVAHEFVPSGKVTAHVIPVDDFEQDVKRRPVTYVSDALPFEITVTKHFRNCRVFPKGPMFNGDGPVIDGYVVVEQPSEKEAAANLAGLYATFRDRQTGKTTDAILWGLQGAPLTLRSGGKTWAVDLIKRRWKLPFTVRLDKFTFIKYPNTKTPAVFLSDVTKIDGGQERSLKISMNEPLRDRGYTLYQADWAPHEGPTDQKHYSVFAVVRNPSDQWPKWSCYVIAIGLSWHFLIKLLRYIKSENRALANRTAGTRATRAAVAPARSETASKRTAEGAVKEPMA